MKKLKKNLLKYSNCDIILRKRGNIPMAKSDTLIALIILECRLSRFQAHKLFENLNCYQLMANYDLSEQIRNGLTFLWNYETALFSEDMAKRAEFLASNLIRRLKRILKVEDKEERKALLASFTTELAGSDMPFLDRPSMSWTADERRKVLKYRYKYALSERELALIINSSKGRISDWISNLNDNDALKKGLITLSEYNHNKCFGSDKISRK